MTDLSTFTPEQLRQYSIELDRDLCRKHFYLFLRRAWRAVFPNEHFADGWHIAAICYHIQALIDGKAYSVHGDEADTLIVNVPPGCGKSRIVSVMLSAWLWARDPSKGQWHSSFGYNVLDRDSLDTRRLIESKWFRERFWHEGIELTDDQNQKRRYNNTAGGWRLAASIESKTGFGEHPDVLNVDDPHDPSQALSDQRLIAIDAWDTKYSTRGIVKGVKKIVICQRLGEGDLSGHILQNEDDVVHLCIPMWYDPERHCKTDIEYYDIDDLDEDGNFKLKRGWEDPRTEPGELMWPQVMTEAKVEKLKKRLRTSHMISAQLQQNPTSPEGDMFQAEWLHFVDAPPTHGCALRSWDLASSKGRKADFTAGALWVYDGDFFYLCDMKRGKWDRSERDRIMMKTAEDDSAIFSDYTILLPQDPGSAGKDAAEILGATFMDAGFRVRTEKITSKKTVNAEPLADGMAAGRVKIVRGAWNGKFVSEILAFDNGANDDQVDASASGYKKVSKSTRFGKIRRPLLLITPEEQQELDSKTQEKDDFSKYLELTEPEEHAPLGVSL